MKNKNTKFFHNFDFILLLTVIILSVIGIIAIGSATNNFENGSSVYVSTQIISSVIGLVFIIIFLKIDYEILGRIYIPIYIFSILLLLTVFIPGIGYGKEEKGSNSWSKIGPISFQPAEFSKIGIILAFAQYIRLNISSLNEPKTLLKILGFGGLPVLLILLQPDFGTAVVFLFFLATMLFLAGLNLKYFAIAVISLVVVSPILWLTSDTYQKNRILDVIYTNRDASGSGYQLDQSEIAIGSGKLYGTGLLKGNQVQGGFLPEKHTDYIFAVISEELGFIGGGVIIFLFGIFLYRLVKISKKSDDIFGSLIVAGIAAMFFFHIIENIAMTMRLVPATGIPLPFLSYGGTFQLSSLIAVAIAINVGMKNENLSF